jgi:hypothetical protein
MTSIVAVQMMDRWDLAELRVDARRESWIPRYSWQIGLMIRDRANLLWHERVQVDARQRGSQNSAH